MAFLEANHIRGDLSDKRYDAGGIAQYMKTFMRSGVLEYGDNLRAFTDGTYIYIDYGKAYVDGFLFQLRDNGTGVHRFAKPENGVYRLVLRKHRDLNVGVQPMLKTGDGQLPQVERTENLYEISLAALYVENGAITIMDERENEMVCGKASVVSEEIQAEDLYVKGDAFVNGMLKIAGNEAWHEGNLIAERGTWTPVPRTIAGLPAISCTTCEGEYYRVGNMVWLSCVLVVNQVLNAGNMFVESIPFAPSNSYGVFPWYVTTTSNMHSAQRFIGQGLSTKGWSNITFSRGADGFLSSGSLASGNMIVCAGTYTIN